MATHKARLFTLITVTGFIIPNGLVLADPVEPPIETLVVSAEYYADLGSSTTLADGAVYYILVEGTYEHANDGQRADGEWNQISTPPSDWVEEEWEGDTEHDLLINNNEYDWWGSALSAPDPVLDYHTYAPHVFSDQHHTYWLPFVGKGDPIRFSIQDIQYNDNEGSLTVSIYVPEPATLSLLLLGGLLVSRGRR